MGHAHYAPMDHYKRKFGVLDIAVQKTREFLQEKQHELGFRDAEDIGNEMDRVVSDAVQNNFFEHIVDGTKPAMLVDLKDTLFEGLFAVVHKDKLSKVNKHEWCVVTTLTKQLVAANKANPNWRWNHAGKPGHGMVALKDKLAPTMTKMIVQAEKEIHQPKPVPSQPPVMQPSTIQLPNGPSELRLVVWPDENDQQQHKLCASPAEASEFVGQLLDEVEPEAIQVLKPHWIEAKKKVKVEIE